MPGPNGLSPFQEGMAEIGLPVTSARLIELVPDPGTLISDRDWVRLHHDLP